MMNSIVKSIGIIATIGSLSLLSTTATAQDLDFDSKDEKKKREKKVKKVEFERDVREIERGMYSKANVGATIYVLNRPGPFTAPVNSLALSIGDDFIDRESMSMAWEVSFLQTVHNGLSYLDQPGALAQPLYFQGDTRGFALMGTYEFSKYPTRRLGVGFRVTGGIMAMPVLMDKTYFQTSVVPNTWGLSASYNHQKPYIPVGGGPTIEYYTKLAHFSVGTDIDVLYIVGWDLGIQPTAYMKYTF